MHLEYFYIFSSVWLIPAEPFLLAFSKVVVFGEKNGSGKESRNLFWVFFARNDASKLNTEVN